MDHPVSICFPKTAANEPRRQQLLAKLEEYRKRVAATNEQQPTDDEPFWCYSDQAKGIILERVLIMSRVDRNELFKELWLNPETKPIVTYSHWQYGNPFHASFDVIFDYVANGGLNTVGGTGLPPPQ